MPIDPATISLILSLAPTVLDLLFGRGHGIKVEALTDEKLLKYIGNKLEKMVDRGMIARGLPGYGLEGYGFRYPKVAGFRTKEGISEEYFKLWAEAYAKNKLTAAANTWVQFLKSKGFYDRMKELATQVNNTMKYSLRKSRQLQNTNDLVL
jgi:hypothetical protein